MDAYDWGLMFDKGEACLYRGRNVYEGGGIFKGRVGIGEVFLGLA